MKTGFLYGGARTPRYVYYFYHGKILQCRKEPWIPPYIYYDTHPAEYPPNYYYECDTLPEGATPPMTLWHNRCVSVISAGGLYDVRSHYCPGYGASDISYYWPVRATAKIEVTASFPTLEIFDPGKGKVTGAIYFSLLDPIGVSSTRVFKTSHGHNYLYDEYTLVQKDWSNQTRRPFTNNIHIILEKKPGINVWSLYFNDEWFFDIANPVKDRIIFWIIGPSSNYGHGTMDYLRAWVDTERT